MEKSVGQKSGSTVDSPTECRKTEPRRPNAEWPNTKLDPRPNRDPTSNDWTPNDQTPKGTERRKTKHRIWTLKDWTPKYSTASYIMTSLMNFQVGGRILSWGGHLTFSKFSRHHPQVGSFDRTSNDPTWGNDDDWTSNLNFKLWKMFKVDKNTMKTCYNTTKLYWS
jgi:hypothetical protein